MITVGICSNNMEYGKCLSDYVRGILLSRHVACSLHLFETLRDFHHWIETEGKRLDIAILSIEKNDSDVIYFAKDLNQAVPTCQVLFLSSNADLAPEVYEAEHVWFILKDRLTQYFDRAIAKCLSLLSGQKISIPGILTHEKGKTVLIPLSNILYISRVGRKSFIKCVDHDHFGSRSPVKLIPSMFSDRFLRCHQGYWVNFSKIRELDHEDFILENGARIPIGRVYRTNARRRFCSSMLKKTPRKLINIHK